MRIARTLLIAIVLLAVPSASFGSILISIRIGPPALPVYVQPPCPAPGYLWTPGYWAYGPMGYYWVPGVWVTPPAVGVLWTPGYWGFAGGLYAWHPGYWGPHVGFYGGINYGFGYIGVGFVGGYWSGRTFFYNHAVTNVNIVNVHNVYVDRTVINRGAIYNSRASFNGPGGVLARPTFQERAAMREQHIAATAGQISHERAASYDRSEFASVNHGRPGVTAMNTINGRRFNQQGRAANGNAFRAFGAGGSHNNAVAQHGNNQTGWRRFSQQHGAQGSGSAQGFHSAQGSRSAQQGFHSAQGFRSTQTSRGETTRTEGRAQNTNRQAADRRANGGKTTQRQQRNTNQRQKGASRQNNKGKRNGDKHNGNGSGR
jgi:hypothetical protein